MKIFTRFNILILVLLLALPLMGCDENAASLKDAMKKSIEIESSRSESNLKVTNNVSSEELNEEMLFLFSLLEEGMTMEVEMESLTSMAMEYTLYGEDLLREEGHWPYEESLKGNIFVKDGKTALKTAADPIYLVVDPADTVYLSPEEAPDLSTIFDEEYNEKQIELMMDFIIPFIEEFSFRFSDVENLGTTDLELPDGTIDAEGIRLQMDLNETMDFIAYSSRQLAASEPFKDYIYSSITLPMEKMKEEGVIPEEEMPSPEEMEELAETSYQMMQELLLQIAEMMEDPQDLQEKYGLEVSITEDYYLDDDGYIRKTVSSYQIQAEHEELEQLLGTPQLDLEFHTESVVWDINQSIKVDFPTGEDTVSLYALMADSELAADLGDGPLNDLYQLFSEMSPIPMDGKQLFIDLESGVFLLNGEPLEMMVEPYTEENEAMLPFLQMGELAGGEVSWDGENRQVVYQDTEREMLLTVDSNLVLVNGQEISLKAPVTIVEDRTMVPAELFEHFTQQFMEEDGNILVIF